MSLTLAILVVSMLLGGAYIVLGIVQMVAPMRAISVYRLCMSKGAYAELAGKWTGVGRWANRIIGAFYILFGCVITQTVMGHLVSFTRAK